MNFFTRFAIQIAHSVYNPEFYRDLANRPFSYSFKYLVCLSLLFTVVASLWYGLLIGPSLWEFITVTGPSSIEKLVPNDLIITVKDGTLSTNQTEPYTIAIPASLKSENSSPVPKNLIVIDTRTPASIDAFRSYDTYILADKHNIIAEKSGGQTQSVTLTSDMDVVVSSTTIASLNQKIQGFLTSWKWALIPGTVLLIAVVMFAFGLAGHLLYLLIATFGIMLVSWMKGRPLSYSKAYQAGMHLITVPLALSLLLLLFGSSLLLFAFSFVLILFAVLNIGSRTTESTIPNTPLEAGQNTDTLGPMNYYFDVWRKYATFSERARRKEYWMFVLFNFIVVLALVLLMSVFTKTILGTLIGILYFVYVVAAIIPNLAVTFRRLHDTDRSGWWLLIAIIPIIGAIVLIVFLAQDGTPGANRFGINPKESTPATSAPVASVG